MLQILCKILQTMSTLYRIWKLLFIVSTASRQLQFKMDRHPENSNEDDFVIQPKYHRLNLGPVL